MSALTPPAALVLGAARAIVGAAVASRRGPPDLTPEGLAAALEDDPRARDALDGAVAARPDLADDDSPGARSARRARADEVHHAVDELLLAGELSPDGPGRVVLPGFGPATWRALAVLAEGAGGAEQAWAAAVAAEPLADLGAAAPVGPVPAPDSALARQARRLLAVQAERQDLRDALIRIGAAARHAAARGEDAGLASIAADAARLEAALAAADADLDALWRAGVRRAAGPGR